MPVIELTVDAWRRNLDVMALGTMLGIREDGKQMIAQTEQRRLDRARADGVELEGGLREASPGSTSKRSRPSILPQIPLARFQKPEDVADCVVFLASKQGRGVTGKAVNSTGGRETH